MGAAIHWDEFIAAAIGIWIVGMLIYRRARYRADIVLGIAGAAAPFAAYWLPPHPVYVATLIVCPLLWCAYILYSRGVW